MVVGEYLLYHYEPSFIAAVIFIALFGITSALHFIQLVRNRTWYFIPFLIGGLFECLGYVGRAMNSKQKQGEWTTGPYIMQSLLLLLAPALFAASIYMVLGRIIRLTGGNEHSVVRVNWLTKIFVAGDVISFLAQSGGGGILAQAKKQSQVNMGQYVITGGLCIQLLFFGLFIVVAAIFHWRMYTNPTQRALGTHINWERHLFVLYIASLFIMVRSVFRVIEYVMGQDGPLLSNEVYLYVFDAALMFLTMLLFNVQHPNFSKADLEDRSSVRRHRRRRSHRSGDVEAGVEYVMTSRNK
ncbi:hypothetical protein BP6252_03434 [Coleophoma cylindrospora]|uniref:Uncharacterized protein n=1 Tax=Coleophoma cylindrospora TaxID=1849047 RepID=A0A3D8S7P8_9HELO|nr:hypothetical protein BP6252_03434 [Coleophoma cylindrospora]